MKPIPLLFIITAKRSFAIYEMSSKLVWLKHSNLRVLFQMTALHISTDNLVEKTLSKHLPHKLNIIVQKQKVDKTYCGWKWNIIWNLYYPLHPSDSWVNRKYLKYQVYCAHKKIFKNIFKNSRLVYQNNKCFDQGPNKQIKNAIK